MPCDYKQYPPDWKAIVARLKELRGDRCELCFAPNSEIVNRPAYPNPSYPWYSDHYISDSFTYRRTKIIITTHHIDSDKKNNSDDNLILLCQRCHLRLDRAKHKAKRRKA